MFAYFVIMYASGIKLKGEKVVQIHTHEYLIKFRFVSNCKVE